MAVARSTGEAASPVHLLRSLAAAGGGSIWSILLALLLAITVLTPIGALIVQSLTPENAAGWSTQAYSAIYRSVRTWEAVKNTLIVIGLVEVIAIGAGVTLAWLLVCCDLPGRKWLIFVPLCPLLFPPLLSALGWIFLLTPGVGFINVGLRHLLGMARDEGPFSIYSIGGIGWVMGLYSVPYVFAVVAPALENLDTRLDEAARICGASTGVCLRTVTLQLILPAIVGGALFAFVVAASEFTIPLLIGTRAHISTISTRIYELATAFPVHFEQGAALAMGLLAVVAGITVLQRWTTTRRSYVTIGGKGGRRDLIPLGRWRWLVAGGILLYVAATVIIPMLAIIVVSLQGFWRADSFTLTLANYHFVLFEQVGAGAALLHSLGLAIVGASCAVILALAISHLTLRHRGGVNTALDVIAALPLGMPSIVFGTGMLITFLKLPVVLYGTLASLLIAYVAHTLPITMRPIASSYIQLDGTLLESASMAGASGPRVMADVILPLLRTGITSAWGLTFVLLLRELPISMMLTTPGNNVISTYLFNLFDTQTFPAVAALAVVLFAVGTGGLVLIGLATKLWRRYR